MKDYVLITDNTCDLPDSFYKEHNIPLIMLPYSIGDTVYSLENTIPLKDFYNLMREGTMPTTMACNPETYKDTFKKYLDEGKDILYLSFTSGLSSSYGNAILAANELNEEYENVKVVVADSLSASMGEGLLLYKIAKLKEEGKSLEEIVKYIQDNRLHVCHYVTVDDLHHLHRGGRVSKTTAIVGTLINVKPMIYLNDEGKLISYKNVRGRKKSLLTLVDSIAEHTEGYDGDNDVIMISHGDCLEDAEFVANLVKERTSVKEVIINYVCPTIGSHAGPGVVAFFFEADYK